MGNPNEEKTTTEAELTQLSNTLDEALSSEKEELPTVPDTSKMEVTPTAEPAKTPETPAPTEKTGTEKETPAPQTETSAEPSTDKNLFAGKYNSTLDLTEAVLEEVKALKADKKDVADLITEAHKTGDWSKVEAKYKEFQAQVEKQIADQKKTEPTQPAQPTTEPAQQPTAEPEVSPQEYQAAILDQSFNDFEQTELAKDFKEAGIEIPRTDEQLAELKKNDRGMYREFMQEFGRIATRNKAAADEFLQADKDAPVQNTSEEKKATQQITDFGKKYKVEIKPEEIQAILKDAKAKGDIFTTKNGVLFIKEGAIFRYFKAEKAEDILDRVQKQTEAEALTRGRTEGHTDATTKNDKGIRSASTVAVPGAKAKAPATIDWKNEESIRAMASESQASEKLDELLLKD